jgi:hypothetical protein
MTYWLLTIILVSGAHAPGLAYGSWELCDRAAEGQRHLCTPIYFKDDR